MVCDQTVLSVLGIDPGDFDGSPERWVERVHPEDLPRVLTDMDEAIRRGSPFTIEYRVSRPDGTSGWVRDTGHVVLDIKGAPIHVIGALRDATDTRLAEDSVGRVLWHMRDGLLAVDDDWRIIIANAEAERIFGPSGQLLGRSLWDVTRHVSSINLEGRFRKAAAEGVPDEMEFEWPDDQRWYHLRLIPVPGGQAIYMADITDRRMREAEHRTAAERTARLGELTMALADALTTRDVVNAVADHVLPPFSAAGLYICSVEGENLRLVGSAGHTPELIERVRKIPVWGDFPISQALRDRAPKFITSADEYIALYPQLADMPAIGNRQAWAFLPLIASGHSLGCCVISFTHPRRFPQEERNVLMALSGLVAQALERARLFEAEHARAQELQRGLLPRALPALPAVTAAARYLPAGKEMEVGGDWYDVIPLSADRVALVIGDVMGHGLSEAATMGRLRTAVHTLSELELPPDEILTHLNDLVNELGDEFYATCLYMLYDPTTRDCAFSQAGHPPPGIVHPDGTIRFPAIDPDPPLGAAIPPFATIETKLPEGSLLVLYTDGLVESATLDIDTGMADLARALTSALDHQQVIEDAGRDTDRYLESLCDAVTGTLLPTNQPTTDDAALLIAQTHMLSSDRIASWELPEDPIAAGQARAHVGAKLAEWGLEALTMTTELLASELVGNVIRHARGPISLRLLRGSVLTCEVSDGSLTTPRIRKTSVTDEGGRGLQLVAALASRWGTRYTSAGKCIWTEQPLPPPADSTPSWPSDRERVGDRS